MSDDASAPVPSVPGSEISARKLPAALAVLKAVSVPARYKVLRELADGSYPPVGDLAKKVGCNTDLMGRHLKLLQKVGLVVRVKMTEDADARAKHYQIPAEFRQVLPDGGRVLDFGSVVLRLPD